MGFKRQAELRERLWEDAWWIDEEENCSAFNPPVRKGVLHSIKARAITSSTCSTSGSVDAGVLVSKLKVKEWGAADVQRWAATQLQLPAEVLDVLEEHEVDGSEILTLTDTDMVWMGIRSLGVRRCLVEAVAALRLRCGAARQDGRSSRFSTRRRARDTEPRVPAEVEQPMQQLLPEQADKALAPPASPPSSVETEPLWELPAALSPHRSPLVSDAEMAATRTAPATFGKVTSPVVSPKIKFQARALPKWEAPMEEDDAVLMYEMLNPFELADTGTAVTASASEPALERHRIATTSTPGELEAPQEDACDTAIKFERGISDESLDLQVAPKLHARGVSFDLPGHSSDSEEEEEEEDDGRTAVSTHAVSEFWQDTTAVAAKYRVSKLDLTFSSMRKKLLEEEEADRRLDAEDSEDEDEDDMGKEVMKSISQNRFSHRVASTSPRSSPRAALLARAAIGA